MQFKSAENSFTVDQIYRLMQEKRPFAIYGMANTGKLLVARAQLNSFRQQPVALFDKKVRSLPTSDGVIDVLPPEDVVRFDFERIFVTNFAASEQIARYLVEDLGVAQSKLCFVMINMIDTGVSFIHEHDWIEGASEEVHFWETKIGSRKFFDNVCEQRINPNKPFYTELAQKFERCDKIRVLDVGSGPVTTLGYKHPNLIIELTMVDPLAEHYAILYDKYDYHPPVKPIKGAGEEIDKLFSDGSFDLVYSNNALDHAEQPADILVNMCKLVRKGGLVYVSVLINEAVEANYQGLHQWNFEVRDERVFLWQPGTEIVVNDLLRTFGDVTVVSQDPNSRILIFELCSN